MNRSYMIVKQMNEADRLSKEGRPFQALCVLTDEPRADYSADYPWGGSVEPYDAAVEAELVEQF